ncbi:alpha/beta hydrolase [Leptolyngbya boryana CZ1]|uniref:Alpha/beta hydrolase n=1 Tax=Leptolyngbya boryana CZ1 TaxID=3060204 RepID=A0AA97AP78_LEPBY|nr:alpha/beta hydrolase [Leptolyngbya boryana]WNZ45547.1 alpha/beta hydrolase [Leptolyngbya boryana CZ1]
MKHDRINTNGINLHYVAEGEGNLMLFLHGFPECWYSWRKQLPEFARDHHAVALDLRGYNESDKPSESSAYKMSELVADVKGAIEGLGYQRCTLVGHDWGGAIAWNFAYEYPEMLDRLIILNLPHPAKFSQGLRTPQQLLKSWYVFLFQIPYLPEFLIQFDDYKLLETALKGMAVNQEVFSAEDINFYKDAFAKRGAATAAINYYRNIFQAGILEKKWGILEVPTLMIWGEKDIALGKELTYGTEEYVRNLQIRYIPNCSHWVQQEQPNLVNQYIREFIGL